MKGDKSMDTSTDTSPEKENPAEPEEASIEETSSTPEEGTSEEKLYAGKYKNVEELEKSYLELQRQNTKVEMDRAELLKARETKESKKTTYGSEFSDEEVIKTLHQIIDDRVRPFQEKAEIERMFTKYDDFGEYSPKTAKKIKENPHMNWEDAYKSVKFDDLARESREEGKKEAYSKIDEKRRAGTTSPSPKASPGRPVEELVKDRSVPLSEIEKQLPHA